MGYQEVKQFSLDNSVSLLNKIIYETAIPLQDNILESRKKIVEAFGRLALAVVQAGAYIRETSCSLHDYLELYERHRRHLQFLPEHLSTDYQYSVYAV